MQVFDDDSSNEKELTLSCKIEIMEERTKE